MQIINLSGLYSFFIFLGFATTFLLTYFNCKKNKIIFWPFEKGIYLLVPISLLFARIGWAFEQDSLTIKKFFEFNNGFSIQIGIFGSLIYIFCWFLWISKKTNISMFVFFELFIPFCLIGFAIGRIGNFVNREILSENYYFLYSKKELKWFHYFLIHKKDIYKNYLHYFIKVDKKVFINIKYLSKIPFRSSIALIESLLYFLSFIFIYFLISNKNKLLYYFRNRKEEKVLTWSAFNIKSFKNYFDLRENLYKYLKKEYKLKNTIRKKVEHRFFQSNIFNTLVYPYQNTYIEKVGKLSGITIIIFGVIRLFTDSYKSNFDQVLILKINFGIVFSYFFIFLGIIWLINSQLIIYNFFRKPFILYEKQY